MSRINKQAVIEDEKIYIKEKKKLKSIGSLQEAYRLVRSFD